MSIFVLKIIAAFFMVVDHIKYALPSFENQFTLYFGRISYPLFAFCCVQGYIHTRDIKKYIIRLLIAGIISEIPYLLFTSLPKLKFIGLNIEFTFIFGLLVIKVYDLLYKSNKKKCLFLISIICVIAILVKVDYGIFGVLLIFSFYIFHNNKYLTLLASSITISGKYLYRILILKVGFTGYPIKNWICTLIPLLLICLYNGKRGPKIKWFFYIFYPLHFLVLYYISP